MCPSLFVNDADLSKRREVSISIMTILTAGFSVIFTFGPKSVDTHNVDLLQISLQLCCNYKTLERATFISRATVPV